MSEYSVQQLARASGVSVRTLHVYDEMGLLKPAARTEARYRQYGEKELLRLQQILFYKELDFSLQEIRTILDDPDFDLVQALRCHKVALGKRQERLTTLLGTIDKTIEHLTRDLPQGDNEMTPEELYEGLPKETAEAYRAEATARWSAEVQRSEEALRAMGKADFGKLKDEMQTTWKALSGMTREDPTSDAVQKRIAQHYALTRAFWGTAGTPDKQAAQYKGLGRLFLDDARYTTIDGTAHPEFGSFLNEAMECFVETVLAE
jgi:DNA-binding transcriptional MerR regulator